MEKARSQILRSAADLESSATRSYPRQFRLQFAASMKWTLQVHEDKWIVGHTIDVHLYPAPGHFENVSDREDSVRRGPPTLRSRLKTWTRSSAQALPWPGTRS